MSRKTKAYTRGRWLREWVFEGHAPNGGEVTVTFGVDTVEDERECARLLLSKEVQEFLMEKLWQK